MQSPRVIGFTVAALMLAIFGFAIFRSLDGVKDGRLIQDLRDQNSMLERRAMDQEMQVAENREELKALEKRAGEAAGIKLRLESALKEKVELEEAIAVAREARKKTLDLARAEKARLQEKARGRKMDSLAAATGRTYTDVEIREATLDGLRISHAEGLASIPAANLPDDLRTALAYDIEIPSDEPQEEVATDSPQPDTAAPAPTTPAPNPASVAATAPAKPAPAPQIDPSKQAEMAKIRARIRMLEAQATAFEAEAKEHEERASYARMRGRPHSHDVEAARDRESARRTRQQILELERTAIDIEYGR